MNVLVNDIHMNVRIEGNGPPLLLLHGFTGALNNWESFFPSWIRYFKVIAVDLIGHGKTDAPAEPDRYSMEHTVKDLAALLDKLGVERVNVLGYSMGGRLALAFACSYPEKVGRLMLESSSPGLKTEEERSERIIRDEALADRIEKNGVEDFVDEWGKIPLFATQGKDAQEKLRRQRLQNCEAGLAGSLRGMGTGAQESFWPKLKGLDVPVGLVVGEWDDKFRRIAEEMAAWLPNAVISTVNRSGHAVHVEQPRIFGTIVIEYFNQS